MTKFLWFQVQSTHRIVHVDPSKRDKNQSNIPLYFFKKESFNQKKNKKQKWTNSWFKIVTIVAISRLVYR